MNSVTTKPTPEELIEILERALVATQQDAKANLKTADEYKEEAFNLAKENKELRSKLEAAELKIDLTQQSLEMARNCSEERAKTIHTLMQQSSQIQSERDDAQRSNAAMMSQLESISQSLCGVKIEGEVTHDMVYAFVEGAIDNQFDLRVRAESQLQALKEQIKQVFASCRTNDDTPVGSYLVESELMLDLQQQAIATAPPSEWVRKSECDKWEVACRERTENLREACELLDKRRLEFIDKDAVIEAVRKWWFTREQLSPSANIESFHWQVLPLIEKARAAK